MPKIVFKNKNVTVEVEKGTSILDAALRHDVPLYHTCGGNCSCSTCRVVVLKGVENLSSIDAMEAEVLDCFDLKEQHRADARDELAHRERLREVVVGADLE